MPKRLDVVINFKTNTIYSLKDYKDNIAKNLHELRRETRFEDWLDDNYCATEIFFLDEEERNEIIKEYLETEYSHRLEHDGIENITILRNCLIDVEE